MTVKKLRERLAGFSEDLEVKCAILDKDGEVVDVRDMDEFLINIDHNVLILK